MTCSRGPPCRPGKTALSTALASSSVQRIAPPRGPRSVLWVVKVTTSATPTGEGWTPPAMRPGRVGGVEHEAGPHRVGDLPERQRVDDPGVGGGAGHDELGPFAPGHVGDLVEVDDLAGLVRVVGGRRHPVGDEAPHLGGDAGRGAVGQVTAVVEPHGQDGVARLEERLVDGQVGVGPGMGLDVGVLGPEQRVEAAPGQVLDLVDDLVAAVVAAARIALGVLVGEDRTGGGQDGGRGEVLRGDELQRRRLALGLGLQQLAHLGVAGQPRVERGCGEWAAHDRGPGLSLGSDRQSRRRSRAAAAAPRRSNPG